MSGGLDRVIEAEARHAARIAAARADAEQRIRLALEAAEARDLRREGERIEALADRDRRLAAEREARAAAIRDETRARVRRYDAVDTQTIARLARWLADQVVVRARGGSGP